MGNTHNQKSIPYSHNDIYRTRKTFLPVMLMNDPLRGKNTFRVLSTNGRGHVRAAHSHRSRRVRNVGGRIIEHMMEL